MPERILSSIGVLQTPILDKIGNPFKYDVISQWNSKSSKNGIIFQWNSIPLSENFWLSNIGVFERKFQGKTWKTL